MKSIIHTNEQAIKMFTQCNSTQSAMKCQGSPVTLVMADPNDPFVLQITEAIKAFVYQTRYGIRLKIADRVKPQAVEDDDDANEVGANKVGADETTQEDEVEHDINYHAKTKKTKNAANGRQQARRAKDAELSNDIKKTTKKIAKVVVTKALLSSDLGISAGEDSTPVATKQTKPTKNDLREKTQIRKNKRVYKTQQGCPCICAKRNLAVHGCLCT